MFVIEHKKDVARLINDQFLFRKMFVKKKNKRKNNKC